MLKHCFSFVFKFVTIKLGGKMKKVVILSLHLGYGGVEKSVAALANMLVSKYDVEIVCSYKLYDKPRFPIDSKVKIRYLINTDLPIKLQEYNVLLKSFKFKKLFRRLNRDYFKKKKTKQFFSDGFNGFTMFKKRKSTMIDYIKSSDADIIISSRDIFDEWLGYYGSKDIVKIGWEHNHFHNNYKYARKIVNSCSKLDYLVLVSKELYDYYSEEMRRYKCKCINIPNVIDKIPVRSSHLTEKRLISVGRLSHEKGFLDLLKIFNKIHEDYPDWHLDIIGDGVDKIKLKDYIQDNDSKVKMFNKDYMPNAIEIKAKDFPSNSIKGSFEIEVEGFSFSSYDIYYYTFEFLLHMHLLYFQFYLSFFLIYLKNHFSFSLHINLIL